ncbi:hypothetical protein PQX77_005750 [Marasmius sp. AFHP31]|nr:hypothetical protein PQX77_005750 [Marasmius sp. AFHP31]
MPAHRLHKTKKDREQAIRDKHKRYYQSNKDHIRTKRKERYRQEMILERKERNADIEEKKQAFWEQQARNEYKHSLTFNTHRLYRNTLEELRKLEKKVNEYLSDSGSTYLERSYHRYLVWTQSDIRHIETSPLEPSYKAFKSMVDAVGKISGGILNEYGAGREWKECQRLMRRIRYLIQSIDDLECAYLEQQTSTAQTGSSLLEERYSKGKLQFQDSDTGQWLDRLHCRGYIAALDEHLFG